MFAFLLAGYFLTYPFRTVNAVISQPLMSGLARDAVNLLQRRGISRLPEVEGSKPSKKKFKAYHGSSLVSTDMAPTISGAPPKPECQNGRDDRHREKQRQNHRPLSAGSAYRDAETLFVR